MEGPEKQNVAELGKQNGPLCSLFSEKFESGCATGEVLSGDGSTWESRHPGKERTQGSVLVTEQERRNFLQEERGKETVLEGGQVREKPKK